MLPPAVTGAVVMLIGFNLAPVAAKTYWPQDQWVALATMTFVIVASLALRGFLARIAILLGLVFGYLLSVLLDATAGPITSVDPAARPRRPRTTGSTSTPSATPTGSARPTSPRRPSR